MVMDLGIAQHQSQAGETISGTLPYMSPEQIAGEPVDARSDIFSAGVVLAEMIHTRGTQSGDTRERIWHALRKDAMQLPEIVQLAQETAGGIHHFRFIQLPFNLQMTEALTVGNQALRGRQRTLADAASELDLTLVASASLLQGQMARNLPGIVAEAFGLKNDAERALQFARSAPGITTALVGMSHVEHVKANCRLVGLPAATEDEFGKLFSRGESA